MLNHQMTQASTVFNTLKPWHIFHHITFLNAFSWKKKCILIQFHSSFILCVQLTRSLRWFGRWLVANSVKTFTWTSDTIQLIPTCIQPYFEATYPSIILWSVTVPMLITALHFSNFCYGHITQKMFSDWLCSVITDNTIMRSTCVLQCNYRGNDNWKTCYLLSH